MNTVSVATLKQKLSQYLRQVEQGEEVVVTSHRRRVARIVPRVGLFAARRETGIRRLDANLRLACAHISARTVLAALLHLVSRFLGAVEIFVIMRVLGTPAPDRRHRE